MWLAAVASWIYRIFTFVVDSKMNVLNTINFLPPIILKWFLNNFGRSAYWFLDMDITIPIVGMGLVFIVIGILFNLAAKKI